MGKIQATITYDIRRMQKNIPCNYLYKGLGNCPEKKRNGTKINFRCNTVAIRKT